MIAPTGDLTPIRSTAAVPEIRCLDKPTGRVYLTPAGELPSVNTILDALRSPAERQKFARSQQQEAAALAEGSLSLSAADRGTLVHAAIATFLSTGIQPDLLPEAVEPYWQAIRFRLKLAGPTLEVEHPVYGGKRLAIELPVYHADLGYAGTLDWLGHWE